MKKYYKYTAEWSDLVDATTYVETENRAEFRRISFDGRSYVASNVIQPNGQMDLASTAVDYEKWLDAVTPITEDEFDGIWQAYLVTRQPQWKAMKESYPIGAKVDGILHLFVPLGAIVKLESNAVGVADYAACKAAIAPKGMYSGEKIKAVVVGYDEDNQWIVLDCLAA